MWDHAIVFLILLLPYITLRVRFRGNAQCFIISEQEECEIWINHRPTGFIAPALLPVHQGRNYHIELKASNGWTAGSNVFIKVPRSFICLNPQPEPLRLQSVSESP